MPYCKSITKRLLSPKGLLFGFLFLGMTALTGAAWAVCPPEGCPPCDTGACAICGDGVVCSDPALCDTVEPCDDGNSVDSDACHNDCTVNLCGNGTTEAGEECDDGNRLGGDGCEADCTLCPFCPACGNGTVDAPAGEECDDGNDINSDACKNDCTENVCGDGIEEPGDECDDGNTNNNDTCTNECKLGFCGDHILMIGGELCDDGNNIDGDGCSDNCLTCPHIECGDGVPQGTEECDDGNDVETDACKADCTENACGDGVLETGVEECDDGNTAPGDGCNALCAIETAGAAICGDGVDDEGEQCDDGNGVNTDACKNSCSFNICGDRVVEIGVEECDDGNTTPGDGCNADCARECPELTCQAPVCGNGVVQEGEECDDGNNVDGDNCRNDCTIRDDECPGSSEDEADSARQAQLADCEASDHKSLICHIPPGNSGAAHTLCIDDNAFPAHIAHGDFGTACNVECPTVVVDTITGAISRAANGFCGLNLVEEKADAKAAVALMGLGILATILGLLSARRKIR